MFSNGYLDVAIGATGTDVDLDLTQFDAFRITGSVTLTSNKAISVTINTPASNVPVRGQTISIVYRAAATYNGGSLIVLGTTLSQELALGDCLIFGTYNGTDWDVVVVPTAVDILRNKIGTTSRAISTGTTNIDLDPNKDTQIQVLTGSGAMTGAYTIGSSAEAKDANLFVVVYKGTITSTIAITLFGRVLTDLEKNSGSLIVFAYYNLATTSYEVMTMLDNSDLPVKASSAEMVTGSDDAKYATALGVAAKITNLLAGNITLGGNLTLSTGGITLTALTPSQILMLDGFNVITSLAPASGFNLAIGTEAGTVMQGSDVRALSDDITKLASFEANEVSTNIWTATQDGYIASIEYTVVKTLSGTDEGELRFFVEATPISGTDVNLPASTIANTTAILTPSANNVFQAGDEISVTSAKATDGGRVEVVFKIVYGTPA